MCRPVSIVILYRASHSFPGAVRTARPSRECTGTAPAAGPCAAWHLQGRTVNRRGSAAVSQGMEPPETPAELIAGDLALARREGAVPPRSTGQLAAAYGVPAGTVAAALALLDSAGAAAPAGGPAAEAGHGGGQTLRAAVAMCRRIEALAGSTAINPVPAAGYGTLTDMGEAMRWLSGQFLATAREPDGNFEYLAGRAAEVLQLGDRLTAVKGGRPAFPWAARSPVAAAFPASVPAVAVAARGPGARGGLAAQLPLAAGRPQRAPGLR